MKKNILFKRLFAALGAVFVFTVFATQSFIASANNSTVSNAETAVKTVTDSRYSTNWIFEPVDEDFSFESYNPWTDVYSTVKGVVYRLKSPNNGKYLTAVYGGRSTGGTADLSFVTKSLDETDDSQKWLFYKCPSSNLPKQYYLSNLGEIADAAYPDRYGRIDYNTTENKFTISSSLAIYESAGRSFVLIYGGEQKLINELKTGQGSNFKASLRVYYPELFLSEEGQPKAEIVLPDGCTQVYLKASKNIASTTQGLNDDTGFRWNIKLSKTESGTKYYTLQSVSTNMYLTYKNNIVYLAPKDDTNTQLWYFNDATAKFGKEANSGIYYIKAYGTTTAITTVESGSILPEDDIQLKTITNQLDYRGTGWVFDKNRGLRVLSDDMTNVYIDTYQWGKGEYYYLFARQYRPITAIAIDSSNVSVAPGRTHQLKAVINPENTTDTVSEEWSSSDTSVAEVDNNGLVTAKSLGTAIITLKIGNFTANCNVTVEHIEITGVELDYDEISVSLNKTATLKASLLPANATEPNSISWKSGDTTAVDVDQNGVITAKKAGTQTIVTCTVSVGSNTFTADCLVKIPMKGIESVSFKKEKLDMLLGTDDTLEYTIAPEDHTAGTPNVGFESSNNNVVTVDANGKIKAVGIGTATVTVTVDQIYTDTCEITVKHIEIKEIILSKKSLTLKKYEKQRISAIIIPDNTTMDKNVLWSTDRPSVAIVSDGLITAIKPGTATITAVAGGITNTCTVTVLDEEMVETERITWTGTLLDSNKNALKGYKLELGSAIAVTDQNGRFSFVNVPVDVIAVKIYNTDGELALSRGFIIEKGKEFAISGSTVQISGNTLEMSIIANGSVAELAAFEKAADDTSENSASDSESPKTGDRSLAYIFSVAAFLSLVSAVWSLVQIKRLTAGELMTGKDFI